MSIFNINIQNLIKKKEGQILSLSSILTKIDYLNSLKSNVLTPSTVILA
jgi:hypothetical protein